MSAEQHDPQLIRTAEQIKRVCAPPPKTNHRKRDRRLFEQSYIMKQEDKLYLTLQKADVDDDTFLILTAVAQHFMREAETERFKSRSAFDGKWAYRNPRKAAAQIHDDMEFVPRACAKLIVEMQSCLSKEDRSGAANYALNVIRLEAAMGIRIAALIELAGFDTTRGARLSELINLVDSKPQPALQS